MAVQSFLAGHSADQWAIWSGKARSRTLANDPPKTVGSRLLETTVRVKVPGSSGRPAQEDEVRPAARFRAALSRPVPTRMGRSSFPGVSEQLIERLTAASGGR